MKEAKRHQVSTQRRSLGIYYTPPRLAKAISDWAVRAQTDTVLEPSFGGCHFVSACSVRLRKLGSSKPSRQLYGCDIDQAAFSFLRGCGVPANTRNFKLGSFLSSNSTDFGRSHFTAIVGNPPFVRHQELSDGVRGEIEKRKTRLPRTASLWAHFLDHSLSMLADEGRLGFVIPSAFLFTRYAQTLKTQLAARFRRVDVIRVDYACFLSEGASEKPIILLAEGRRTSSRGQWREWACTNEDDVVALCSRLRRRSRQGIAKQTTVADIRYLSQEKTYRLGEAFEIRIGIVTGANKYFVLDDATVTGRSLPLHALTPLVPRSMPADGIQFSKENHSKFLTSGRKAWLFSPSSLGERKSSVRSYLATVPRNLRKNTLWFRKRKNWFQPDIGQFPDAALTYMNHRSVRLIVLDGSSTCTNTLHKLYLREGSSKHTVQEASLSLLTTYTQLSAEKVGRPYGGGVLKLEPSEAASLELVRYMSDDKRVLKRAFVAADRALRSGDATEATRIADNTLLRPHLGKRYEEVLKELNVQLTSFRERRLAQPGLRASE